MPITNADGAEIFFVHRNEQGGTLRGIVVKCIMNEKVLALRAIIKLRTPHRRSLNMGIFPEKLVMNDVDSITGRIPRTTTILSPAGGAQQAQQGAARRGCTRPRTAPIYSRLNMRSRRSRAQHGRSVPVPVLQSTAG